MKALLKRPGKVPVWSVTPGTIREAFQAAVGGKIDVSTDKTMAGRFAVLSDKGAKEAGQPYNCEINNVNFWGNILIVGIEGEEFTDLPEAVARIIVDYITWEF